MFVFLIGCFSVTAQEKGDFRLMLSNSIDKMYQNPDAGIKAIKSISILPEDTRNQLVAKTLLAESYSLKANYEESLKMALENVNAKHDLNSNDQLLNNIGMIQQLQNLGLYDQSSLLINSVLKNTKVISAPENRIVLALLYQLQAKTLFNNNKTNEALSFLDKSNLLCKANENSSYNILCSNIFLKSRIALQLKDYKNLNNYVNELDKISTEHPENNYVFVRLEKLKASILFNQQEYKEAISHLDLALDRIKNIDFLGLKNNLYEDLAKNHLALRNVEEHETYQKLHLESQNKIDQSQKEAIQNLMQLNQEFQNQNLRIREHKNLTNLYWSLGAGFILILLIGFWLFQTYQKNQFLNNQLKFVDYQKRLFETKNKKEENLTSPRETQESPEENLEDLEQITKQKSFSISKEKEDLILKKLSEFESSKNFMDRNMSLAALATQLEVNTKYLSEVVKNSKGKNFTTYINELKINHIAYLISTDPTYRQYKISYLAELAGFASHSTFSVVFKNVTGVTPNDYIQQISKRKII
ncbi:AraC family transcriptional regulator [Soonwooa sp.]|uniref:helix-turn-helix domain-containing protein n=1 Tax=Soonwooa sp. TaxID=1938592 RepID=UPI0026284242|nr:AraC family transcriptional regulator [Soonwooa sp.]